MRIEHEIYIHSGAVPPHGRWTLDPSRHGTTRLAKPKLAHRFRSYHKSLRALVAGGL
jgi:hypothetical protein